MNKVAVVIVNWNGKIYLSDCLKSLHKQTYANFDVILVDNNSNDGSVNFVKECFPSVKIICLDRNYGFAKGNNIGIKLALKDTKIKYIAILNNDTITDKNWLLEMTKLIDVKKKIGMISSQTVLKNGLLHNIGLCIQKDIYAKKEGGISSGFGEDPDNYKKVQDVFCPGGVSALLARELLEDVGLFDEDFFAYAEDIDLGYRARLNGWKSLYCPTSKLIHLHSMTGGKSSPFKTYLAKRNGYYYVIKNYPFWKMISYPFREIFSNLSQVFQKGKNPSYIKLKSNIGLLGMIWIIIRVYISVIISLPVLYQKRRMIYRKSRVDLNEQLKWFKKYS